jgi:hypothetical protein
MCSVCRNEQNRERYQNDSEYREKIQKRVKENFSPEKGRVRYYSLRDEALRVLGGPICNGIIAETGRKCGFSDPRALQIDHIENDGYSHRREGVMGTTLYRKVISMGGVGFQVLCANCNWIKRFENNNRGGPRAKGRETLM